MRFFAKDPTETDIESFFQEFDRALKEFNETAARLHKQFEELNATLEKWRNK